MLLLLGVMMVSATIHKSSPVADGTVFADAVSDFDYDSVNSKITGKVGTVYYGDEYSVSLDEQRTIKLLQYTGTRTQITIPGVITISGVNYYVSLNGFTGPQSLVKVVFSDDMVRYNQYNYKFANNSEASLVEVDFGYGFSRVSGSFSYFNSGYTRFVRKVTFRCGVVASILSDGGILISYSDMTGDDGIYVPTYLVNDYKGSSDWSDYSSRIFGIGDTCVDGGVKYWLNNGKARVYGYTNDIPSNLVIPSSINYGGNSYTVDTIADNAFQNCSQISSLTMPASIAYLEGNAFTGCNIQTINYERSGSWWSYVNGKLSVMPSVGGSHDKWKDIFGDHPLLNLRQLVYEAEVSGNITSLGHGDFQDCENLVSVNINDGVEVIEGNIFSGCSRLEYLRLPDSVTDIYGISMRNSTSLKTLVIGSGWSTATNWYYGSCVQGCNNLREIYNFGSLTQYNLPTQNENSETVTWYAIDSYNNDGTINLVGGNSTPTEYTQITAGKHLIRSDMFNSSNQAGDNLYVLSASAEVALKDDSGTWTISGNNAYKVAVAGACYGPLPEANDGVTILDWKNGLVTVKENSVVVANATLTGSVATFPGTGVRIDVVLPMTAISVALVGSVGAWFVMNKKRKPTRVEK